MDSSRGLKCVSAIRVIGVSSQFISNTRITTAKPKVFGDPGAKDVIVRNPDGQLARLCEKFTYNPPPVITEIPPNFGPAFGGTRIVIRGKGFLPSAQLIIGERPIVTGVRNNRLIKAVTSSNREGFLNIVVLNPDTQDAVIRRGFHPVVDLVYNYPNPFRPPPDTTFRYVTNDVV